ncbi:hypothetical protein Athai_64990 [Actinocatenispora thailandica]|uniref:Uncharacterized protein n=1 Tax=Actinocatenispora thailandica TaxID=227318 RepID=A0A7R7DWL0_9ACTN|nr:hypothetical protein Athai_64990 [Actinocatenispora thailandica]
MTLGAVLVTAGCVRTYLPESPVISKSPGPLPSASGCSPSPTAMPGLGVTPDGPTPGAYGTTPGAGLPTAGARPSGGGGGTGGPLPPTATAPPYPTGSYRPPAGPPATGLPTGGGIGTPNPGVPGETGCPSGSATPGQPGTGLPSGPGTIPLPTGTGPIGGPPAPAVTACPAYAPSDRTILTLAALKAAGGLPTGTTVASRRCADEYLVADLSAPRAGTIRVVLQHGTGGWHAVAVGSYPCHALSTAPPAARNLLDCD